MSRAYYNEHDPYAAQWLRNLIAAGHIAAGDVDERSIADVKPDELISYTQCHFFAGIGIWSLALRRNGWADERPIWTGSCPCQPFSAGGKGEGFNDERHLWPHWHWLIQQCQPSIIVGEQASSKNGLRWFDLVSVDLENTGYAVGASDLCAAGFDGAHIRQRLYFAGVADAQCAGLQGGERQGPSKAQGGPGGHSGKRGGGDALCQAPMLGRHRADWLQCENGYMRPVDPGSFPLGHEASSRMGRLRAYGNGLDLETAEGFIGALMECLP